MLLEEPTMYQQIVVILIYSTITQLDIAYYDGIIKQYKKNPRRSHLNVVRRVLRYFAGTVNCGILYDCRDQFW